MYRIEDKYYLRVPKFPIKNGFDEIDIESIRKNDVFEESILIANPIVHKKFFEDNKSDEGLLKTIRDYYSRMSLRATPFGEFSGVSFPLFLSESAEKQINRDFSFRKSVHPDMLWTLSLLKSIETNNVLFRKLKVTWNPIVFLDRTRWVLNYNSGWGVGKEGAAKKRISILNNQLMDFIRQNTVSSITVENLINRTMKDYS